MSINQLNLKYFEVVARTQHFTQAAKELYISQSALSKAINNLEQEIGVPLFERQGRNVHLTHYGKIFSDYVFQSNTIIEKGIQQIQDMANVQTGEVRISSTYTIGANYIPEMIAEYVKTYPDVKINYYQKSTSEIIDDVLSSKADLGFCEEFMEYPQATKLAFERIKTEELCLIVLPSHPLANRKAVEFSEIVKETFVGYNKKTGIGHSIYNTLEQAGITDKLNFSFYANEDNTIASMVRAGLGIGIIADLPTIYTEGLVRIHFNYPHFYRNLYMVWNSERYLSPAIKSFRNFILTKSHL